MIYNAIQKLKESTVQSPQAIIIIYRYQKIERINSNDTLEHWVTALKRVLAKSTTGEFKQDKITAQNLSFYEI